MHFTELTDPANVNCAFHQSGHVWFLQGASRNGVVHRSCSIPTGTMLFFPIFDSWVDAMLAPLSPGRHVVHWTASGQTPFGAALQDITYTLTVVPRGRF